MERKQPIFDGTVSRLFIIIFNQQLPLNGSTSVGERRIAQDFSIDIHSEFPHVYRERLFLERD